MTLEELFHIVSAGYGDDLAQHVAHVEPLYRDFMADAIIVTVHDDDQDRSYRIRGYPFRRFGVRVWPEVLPQLGLDPRELRPGANAVSVKVRAELDEHGKPKKIVGPAGCVPPESVAVSRTPFAGVDRAALVRFLARELVTNFDPQASTAEQLATAYELAAEAARLLQDVADKLRDARTVDAHSRRHAVPGEECPACGMHVGMGNACDVVLCPICHATLEWNGAWADISPQPDDEEVADENV